jgi:hypothetical protein
MPPPPYPDAVMRPVATAQAAAHGGAALRELDSWEHFLKLMPIGRHPQWVPRLRLTHGIAATGAGRHPQRVPGLTPKPTSSAGYPTRGRGTTPA